MTYLKLLRIGNINMQNTLRSFYVVKMYLNIQSIYGKL